MTAVMTQGYMGSLVMDSDFHTVSSETYWKLFSATKKVQARQCKLSEHGCAFVFKADVQGGIEF